MWDHWEVAVEIRGWDAAGDGVCRNALCHHIGVWGASGSVGNTTCSQAGRAGLIPFPRDISSSWLQIVPCLLAIPLSMQGKMPFSIVAAGSFFQTGLEPVSGPET